MQKIGFIASLTLALSANGVVAQEIQYPAPPTTRVPDCNINLMDIVAEEDYCKMRVELTNASTDAYLRYDGSKTGCSYGSFGTFYSNRGKTILLPPSDAKAPIEEAKGGGNRYSVPSFEVLVQGLSRCRIPVESLPMDAFPIEVGMTDRVNQQGFEISTVKSESKKFSLSIRFVGSEDQLGFVDLKNTTVLYKTGQQVASFTISPNKPKAMLPGEELKITISVPSSDAAFSVNWGDAFKVGQFEPVAVAAIKVGATKAGSNGSSGSTTTTTTTTTHTAQTNTSGSTTTTTTQPSGNATTTTVNNTPTPVVTNCQPYQAPKVKGKTQVNIYNIEGECFNFSVDNIPVPQQTSNATVYLGHGTKEISVQFAGGELLRDQLYLMDTWESATFKIKRNRKGVYVINMDLLSVVLNEKGEAELAAQTAAANSSSTTEPTFSSGSTAVKLKIHYKGIPAASTYVTIKAGGTEVGNNKTDLAGNITIKTDKLTGKKIDVHGKKGDATWQAIGMCLLDNNYYAELDLYEVAQAAADMTNGDADAIGRNWGFGNQPVVEPIFSSGNTSVKVKIMFQGNPVPDTYITLKHGNAEVGNNKTDATGRTTIKTNNLTSKKVDIYGKKGFDEWKAIGFCVLDANNYGEIDLYEVAKSVASMTGGNADQIAKGWGFTGQPAPNYSTGNTAIYLKVTYKGLPVPDAYITLKQGTVEIGNNKTDSYGKSIVRTNILSGNRVDVYGKKGNYSWKAINMCVLDSKLSGEIDLYQVAKSIAEMTGGNADEIARGWGF